MQASTLFLVSSCLVSPCLAQGAVHVVDAANGPGAEFTDLGAAIAASASGDVLLVRTGFYDDWVRIDGKSLTLVADEGADVTTESLDVSSLGASQFVLVRGVRVPTTSVGANVHQTLGPVWIESCELGLDDVGPFGSGGNRATACSTLVLSHANLYPTFQTGCCPVDTLDATGSRLHLFSCFVEGIGDEAAPGGEAAVELTDSFLEVFGSTIVGGDGLDATSPFFCSGHDGGDGLVLYGAASQARILDSLLTGGSGGQPYPVGTGCTAGQPGQPLLVNGGSATVLSGRAHDYEVSSPVRESALVSATITGNPGDLAWIAVSGTPGAGVGSKAFDGELLVQAPQVVFAGTIPASGVLPVSAPAPALAPGVESAIYFSQAIVRDAATHRFAVSTPSALVELDDAF